VEATALVLEAQPPVAGGGDFDAVEIFTVFSQKLRIFKHTLVEISV